MTELGMRYGNRIIIPGGGRVKAARNRSPWKGVDDVEDRPLKRTAWDVGEEVAAPPVPAPMPTPVMVGSPEVATPFLCRRLSFTFLGDYTFGSPKGSKSKGLKVPVTKKVTVVPPENATAKPGFTFKSPAITRKSTTKVMVREASPAEPEVVPTFKPVINKPRFSTKNNVTVKQTLKSTAALRSRSAAAAPTVTAPPAQPLFHFKRNKPKEAEQQPKPDRGPLSPINLNTHNHNIGSAFNKDTKDSVVTTATTGTNGVFVFKPKKNSMSFSGGNLEFNTERARDVEKARKAAAVRSRSRSQSARVGSVRPPLVLPRWNF